MFNSCGIFDQFTAYIEGFSYDFVSQLLIANMNDDVKSFEIINELLDVAISLIDKSQKSGQIRNTSDPAGLYVVLCRYYDGCVQYWCTHRGDFDVRKAVRKGFELALDVAPEYRLC